LKKNKNATEELEGEEVVERSGEMGPKFSIIIANWNGKEKLGELLDRCLASVLNTKYDNFEIIFLDNGSTDGSYEYICSKYPVKAVRNPRNLGGVGKNKGLKACDGEIVVLLDNDTMVDARWLEEPAKLFENPEIGIVQANLRLLAEPSVADSTGHCISVLGLPVENSFFMEEPKEPTPIFAGKGAALFVRKELFERLNGFDEDYFFYFEETDLCWRARLLGYEVYFSPRSVVLHKGSGTFKNGKLLFHRQKNTIASMIKCYEFRNLILYLPLRLLFEFASIFFLLFRNPSLAFSDVKALVWVLRNMRNLVRKRREIQKQRVVSDKELFERGFIVKSLGLTVKYLRSRFKRFEAVVVA